MVFNPFDMAMQQPGGYLGVTGEARPINPFEFAAGGLAQHNQPMQQFTGLNQPQNGQGLFGGGYGEGISQMQPTQPGGANPFGSSEGYGGPFGGVGGYSTPGTVLGFLTGTPLGLIGSGIDVYNDYGEAGALNPGYSPGFLGWGSGIFNELSSGNFGTSFLDQATDDLTERHGYDRLGPQSRGGRRGGADRDRGGPQGNSRDIRDSGSF